MVRDRRTTLETAIHGNVPDPREAFFGSSIIFDLPQQNHVQRCALGVHVREMAEHLRSQRSKHLFEFVVSSEDAAPEVRHLYRLGKAAGLLEQVLHRGKIKSAFHPRECRART
jgi:hypothetical protein